MLLFCFRIRRILWQVQWHFVECDKQVIEKGYVYLSLSLSPSLSPSLSHSLTHIYIHSPSPSRANENLSITELLEKYVHPSLSDPVIRHRYYITSSRHHLSTASRLRQYVQKWDSRDKDICVYMKVERKRTRGPR